MPCNTTPAPTHNAAITTPWSEGSQTGWPTRRSNNCGCCVAIGANEMSTTPWIAPYPRMTAASPCMTKSSLDAQTGAGARQQVRGLCSHGFLISRRASEPPTMLQRMSSRTLDVAAVISSLDSKSPKKSAPSQQASGKSAPSQQASGKSAPSQQASGKSAPSQ